jgi:hypothetical protein
VDVTGAWTSAKSLQVDVGAKLYPKLYRLREQKLIFPRSSCLLTGFLWTLPLACLTSTEIIGTVLWLTENKDKKTRLLLLHPWIINISDDKKSDYELKLMLIIIGIENSD